MFVYLTADWCLTCKVNEAAAIDRAATRAAFAKANIAVLRGDWTDGNATVGALIESFGRAGVPLYIFYPANGAEPRLLPAGSDSRGSWLGYRLRLGEADGLTQARLPPIQLSITRVAAISAGNSRKISRSISRKSAQ